MGQAAEDSPGEEPAEPVPATSGRILAAMLVVATAWAGWGLARHPAFQPVHLLRISAPILALLVGGAFTQLVARVRRQVDGEREFDRGGKALFMGFVMVAATLLAWLLLSQAIPSTLTALAGSARSEPGIVARKVPATSDADCRFRLEVVSASPETGAVPRPLDECVDEALWTQAAEGEPVVLQLMDGALGAELVGVAPAHR
ncbi:MAG: hypothetical protein M3N82_05290 [Pseudomonadota bacterium]|nr:hypothetical protein [Pseudomonadota bacterium]